MPKYAFGIIRCICGKFMKYDALDVKKRENSRFSFAYYTCRCGCNAVLCIEDIRKNYIPIGFLFKDNKFYYSLKFDNKTLEWRVNKLIAGKPPKNRKMDNIEDTKPIIMTDADFTHRSYF